MTHWILFPHEDAFYPGMGRELYEQEDEYRSFCKKAEKSLRLPLHRSVFYQETPFPSYLVDRQSAVAVISLANFYHFRKSFPNAGDLLLCGQGMGLLTALVAAEAISLQTAVGRLRGKRLSARQISIPNLPVYSLTLGELKDSEQILKAVELALREREVWKLPEAHPCLDIGPGRVCVDALPESIVARLDEPGDPQYIWSLFQTKRLWNKDYCAKRLFGIATATPNENDNCDGKRLDAQEKEFRELLRPLFAQPPASISEEVFARCAELLRENFAEKCTPAEEIALRFRLLAQETLILLPEQL